MTLRYVLPNLDFEMSGAEGTYKGDMQVVNPTFQNHIPTIMTFSLLYYNKNLGADGMNSNVHTYAYLLCKRLKEFLLISSEVRDVTLPESLR